MPNTSLSSAYFPPPSIASEIAMTSSMSSNSQPGRLRFLEFPVDLGDEKLQRTEHGDAQAEGRELGEEPKDQTERTGGLGDGEDAEIAEHPRGICGDGCAFHRWRFGRPCTRKTVPRARRSTRSATSEKRWSEAKKVMAPP